MKKYILIFILIATLIGCASAPITGRSQLLLVGKQEIIEQSSLQYNEVISSEPIVSSGADTRMIKKVGDNMAIAVEKFLLSDPRYASLVNDFDWEFNLIKSDQANAWCMPGGKVAFYTGILPYTRDEAGVAVVMGHEIAHAVADHGRERMSQELLKQYGGTTLSNVLASNPTAGSNLLLEAYGAASGLTILKYSRDHELEADKLGLIFMKIAGYDPNAAPAFWERMSSSSQGEPLEFFSTHPNSSKRIEEINSYLKSEEFKRYTN